MCVLILHRSTLTITDNRTGKSYEIPIENDTIKAIDLRGIKVNDKDFGTMYVFNTSYFSAIHRFFHCRSYDPGYFNTAVCKSAITYIDGEKGILEYRGYPVEQLAEQSSFLEVAFLLIYGFLPNYVCNPTKIMPNVVSLSFHRSNLNLGTRKLCYIHSYMKILYN